MRGKQGVRVVMLSPAGRMSPFQTAQMFSLLDDNIFNVAIDGVFDTCQDLVKAVSNDAQFKAQWSIGTVNSINWARVVAQVVYYVHGWLRATDTLVAGGPVSFTVPSGNFGNVLAGHLARRMGVPIARLVAWQAPTQPVAAPGAMRGQITLTDDFDAPLDGLFEALQ